MQTKKVIEIRMIAPSSDCFGCVSTVSDVGMSIWIFQNTYKGNLSGISLMCQNQFNSRLDRRDIFDFKIRSIFIGPKYVPDKIVVPLFNNPGRNPCNTSGK